MKTANSKIYMCPETTVPLICEPTEIVGDGVKSGSLVAPSGRRYRIEDGIPDLTFPSQLVTSDQASRDEYDRIADQYDANMYFTFQMFKTDEISARSVIIDELQLKSGSRVLEIGAGSGRDSALLARRLGSDSLLCVQDLSRRFLLKAVERLRDVDVATEFSVGNASYLPFANGFFDAVFHFGGLNTFGDIRRALAEAARVTRRGGRVVIGDEGVGPWLSKTEYGRILANANEMYGCSAPLDALPETARNVKVQWIIGDAFYFIAFEIGDEGPRANFDIEVPGARGGTFRTRYYGRLEGVSEDVKKQVVRACKKSGLTMFEWLNRTLAAAARTENDS